MQEPIRQKKRGIYIEDTRIHSSQKPIHCIYNTPERWSRRDTIPEAIYLSEQVDYTVYNKIATPRAVSTSALLCSRQTTPEIRWNNTAVLLLFYNKLMLCVNMTLVYYSTGAT